MPSNRPPDEMQRMTKTKLGRLVTYSLRTIHLALLALYYLIRFVASWLQQGRLRIDTRRLIGISIRQFALSAGGMFPKMGQQLSMRVDLIPLEVTAELEPLHDWATASNPPSLHNEIKKAIRSGGTDLTIEHGPIGVGSMAHVYRGTVATSSEVLAFKIRIPGVRNRLESDLAILNRVAKFIAILPGFRQLPVNEAVRALSESLYRQLDFRLETETMESARQFFSNWDAVVVPETIQEYSSDSLISMKYLPGCKRLTEAADNELATTALNALYAMIFDLGLVHCDFHPGNLLVDPDGKLVLLDFGYAANLSENVRKDFAEFFLSIALNDPSAATEIIMRTAVRVPPDLAEGPLRQEVEQLLSRTAGRKSGEFDVVIFVGELFRIQRHHNIKGTPDFTMAILALACYDGLIKRLGYKLDFQAVAIPHLVRCLLVEARD